jgi:hypothetical protein
MMTKRRDIWKEFFILLNFKAPGIYFNLVNTKVQILNPEYALAFNYERQKYQIYLILLRFELYTVHLMHSPGPIF